MERRRLPVGKLWNAQNAWIPEPKLRDYVLNPDHKLGGHKARAFSSLLSIERDDWEFLRDQILDRIREAPASGAWVRPPYGIEYEVVVPITGRNGASRPVVTAWILDRSRTPRFTSARVITRGRGPRGA